VKVRDGDGAKGNALWGNVVSQVIIPRGMQTNDNLRGGEGGEKGEGKEEEGQADGVPPRERAFLWRCSLPSRFSSFSFPPNSDYRCYYASSVFGCKEGEDGRF